MKTKLTLAILLLLPAKLFAMGETTSFFDSAWSGAGFIMGYGDRDAYIKYACDGKDPGTGKACDGPLEDGMTRGLIKGINSLTSTFTYSKCSDMPTSGTTTATMSIAGSSVTANVTFATPKQKIPTGYDNAGTAFDRRLEISFTMSGDTVKMVLEGSCAVTGTGFFSINQKVGSNAPGYYRPMNIWMGSKSGLRVADVYVSEVNGQTGLTTSSRVRSAYGFSIQVDDSSGKYNLWGGANVYYGSTGNTNMTADIYNLTGNYKTHKVSIRSQRFVSTAGTEQSGNTTITYYTPSALTAISGSDSAVLSASTKFDLTTARSGLTNGSTDSNQGCITFAKTATAPSAATACTDLDYPTTAPTPVGDSTGAFSAKWIFTTMHTKLVDVPQI